MFILLAVIIAAAIAGGAMLQTRYRHKFREPAGNCLAPNRSRGPNRLCQRATAGGGYCGIHQDQHTRDNATVVLGIICAVALVIVGVWVQTHQ